MNLYQVELKIFATAYIKASSEDEAIAAAKELQGQSPAIADSEGDIPISGLAFNDPELPDVSISPAMTIGSVSGNVEVAEEDISEEQETS